MNKDIYFAAGCVAQSFRKFRPVGLNGYEKALESFWVSFEIEEAWYEKLQKRLASALVYIIDSSVTTDKIPKWLQRGLIRSGNVAKVIARDIKFHLHKTLQERQQKFFVGTDVPVCGYRLTTT